MTPTQAPEEFQWAADLVARIQADDDSAVEELYAIFQVGMRNYIDRMLGANELEDRIHEAFLIVWQQVKRGDLREPARLMGYARTVVRCGIGHAINSKIRHRDTEIQLDRAMPDHHLGPERQAADSEQHAIALRLLNGENKQDREILDRFYLQDQTESHIRRDMHLTQTQFRLHKSRTTARLAKRWGSILRRHGTVEKVRQARKEDLC